MSKVVETPLMKQYYSIKSKHPDAILLFRVGDFYETFSEDAVKASQIAVGHRGGFLDVAKCLDEVRFGRHRRAGDVKVVLAPLRLHAVVGVFRDLFLAQEVLLDSVCVGIAHFDSCILVAA